MIDPDLLPILMFASLALLVFSGFPVAFILMGTAVLFGGIAWIEGYFSLVQFYNIGTRIYGAIGANLVLAAIPMFIFMGTMLEKSGIAEDLLHSMQILMRRTPGGLALAVILMGTILAATTGIVGASVIMLTLLALPTLLNRGYDPRLATGAVAASGTLGILIPPSIMLIILADLLATPVGTLFAAALFPGLLLCGLYLLYILGTCALQPARAPVLPKEHGPESLKALIGLLIRSFVPAVFLILMVLGSILFGWTTPTEAAGAGAFGAVLLALINRRLNWAVLKEVLHRSAQTNIMIFGIFIGATAFAYVFRALGGDFIVVDIFEGLNMGAWGTLITMMVVIFLLGFLFDWIEILLIVLPIFTPIVRLLDFGAHVPEGYLVTWFAILVSVNLQTSYLTPPFGYALFYMKGSAPPGVSIQQIYKGIVPFVGLQLIGLAALIAYPEVALWLPEVVFDR